MKSRIQLNQFQRNVFQLITVTAEFKKQGEPSMKTKMSLVLLESPQGH